MALDVLDCGNAEHVAKRLKLYTGCGFAPLPSSPLRLFLPLARVQALSPLRRWLSRLNRTVKC